jgi:hypothetical protein
MFNMSLTRKMIIVHSVIAGAVPRTVPARLSQGDSLGEGRINIANCTRKLVYGFVADLHQHLNRETLHFKMRA